MKEIVVDGETFVPKTSSSPVKIVILQRGWVMVGRFSRAGDDCVLEDASVIRIWGTDKGLGQIALNGPTPKTVLDATGRVEFHILTVVAALDAVEGKWVSRL